jgi:hypothetical protein
MSRKLPHTRNRLILVCYGSLTDVPTLHCSLTDRAKHLGIQGLHINEEHGPADAKANDVGKGVKVDVDGFSARAPRPSELAALVENDGVVLG